MLIALNSILTKDLLQEHNTYCNAGNLSENEEYQEHGVKSLF